MKPNHIQRPRVEALAKEGNRSAKRALREAKKLSQPMFFLEDGKVSVREWGEFIREVEKCQK